MAGLKSLMSRRRRVGEEGEDEEGPMIVDDSQSEGSVLSDEGDTSSVEAPSRVEASGEADSAAAASEAAANGAKAAKKPRKPRKKSKKGKETGTTESLQSQPTFKAMADTEAMMNGLRIDNGEQAQGAVDFEKMDQNGSAVPAPEATVTVMSARNSNAENPIQKQRREHEEYRRKRDADPAHIPNRGNFFMHDTRSQHNGQPSPAMRGAWQGRGRGRGGPVVGGPFSPANQVAQAERAAEQTWKHDLHDTINEEFPGGPSAKPAESLQQRDVDDSARLFPKQPMAPRPTEARVVSFSSTTLVGKVQIRVSLPGMKAPIAFSEVPWKHYIRLPNHRPPLRRDKPVRVSLPDRPPHYIFPSHDRSFVFIPRQNRPNQHQQGYHRGSYQRSAGGYGYSSRRTSMYGGSMYASSVGASRRSSLAGISRADAFSPTSFASGMPPPNRPVIRLPHGAQQHFSGIHTPSGPMSGQHTPNGMMIHTYPLPQQPAFQGTPTSTVHQPRPQKTISVTGIESPALLQQAPSQEPQPFQNQLPAHMHQEQQAFAQPQQPYYTPHQQYAYPQQQQQQQPQAGTPLSGIPEQVMHAQAFQQPPAMPYGQSPFYAPYSTQQQQYYYSPPGPNGYQPMPMYMPSQAYATAPPAQMPLPGQMPQSSPQVFAQEEAPSEVTGGLQDQQSGMVARESNGMVFYVPQSEAQQDQDQQYQPAESFVPSYAMPGLPPPRPAPETSTAYYYPQIQPGLYFPPQSQ
ncbi:hypothetical protein LTR36_009740 [Oleoguttula mirabilis]|uniref:Btz domain-containing protein n=1 Tax=Oleoguttula mirabilis TaxID=1507867 RepID=A0AAV9J5S9_9PEZI|nr:hypothetical protein LTR36_009740 [Oleoguttula mirabilis]